MCSNVQDKVQALGFGPFLSLPMLKANKALMMALVERWSLITQTFHLPMGENDMLFIDFYMMTDLSIDGTPPITTNDFDAKLVARCIGPQPMEYYKGVKGVLASWFEKKYVLATNQSTLAGIDFSTHTFLIYILTHSIFCRKSDRVYFHLLPSLDDLGIVGTYSWGRSALGWMYTNMSEVSVGQGPHSFLGLYFLWEV